MAMEGHEPDEDTDSPFIGSSRISSEPLQVHVEHSVVVDARPLTPLLCDESFLDRSNGMKIIEIRHLVVFALHPIVLYIGLHGTVFRSQIGVDCNVWL
jgi:hypothetical protein